MVGMTYKILPANSFIKLIEPIWLPTHIKESTDFRWFKPEREVFVYCHFGIIIIPLSNIRRVN